MALHGERLDKPTYSLLKSIGGGTTGQVSLWDHEIFGIPVVQKTVSLLGLPDGVARSEPRVLEGLRHANLVRVREAQWDPEYDRALLAVTFTTDYYEGRSVLAALEEDWTFSIGDTMAVVQGLLKACAYLHDEKALLHRDIKPGNVMLDGRRTHPYLGDLGSAAALDPKTRTTAAVGGTPLYRPPEGTTGVFDVRSDLYGVGCVMLEMLNGRLPYGDIDRDGVDTRLAGGRRALPDRYYLPAAWVPKSVAGVLRKLLARDPDARFESAAQALRVVRNTAYVSWRRTAGTGLIGTWHGHYPPTMHRSKARIYEVELSPIGTGRHAGELKMTARWRRPDGQWRGYASLSTRAALEDAGAVAAFFRRVEAAAHSAPTS